jgi:hypothetical protein
MLEAMLLAHLLGDYVFQGDRIAEWKKHSAWGLLVHGGIIALCTWLCSLAFSPAWWPYALFIGVVHTMIDVVRTRFDKVKPNVALLLLLLDQALHALVFVLVVRWSGWLGARPAEHPVGEWLQTGHRSIFLSGYVLLSVPAWVLVHYVVNSTGAVSKSLPGRPGEKYVGMLERALIATFCLLGQFLAVPLVLAPRLALDGHGDRLAGERIGYLGELLASVCLAMAVGLFLRQLL